MKQKILFFILCVITITGYSQFTVGLQKTIGGNSDDELGGIWLTTDGGLIAAGRSYSDISGDKTDYNRGIDDYWVVKLNRAGNVQWQRTLGGSDVDECIALQQTKDGGYILAGNSQSNISGEKTENSKGVFDCWIIKLDQGGNIKWQKTLGGDQYEFCNSIQQTTDGGYIVGCMSNSNAAGDKSEDSKGGFDYWLIKLDRNGNKQWDKTLGGSSDEFVNDVIQTSSDGGYIAVGLSNSTISGDKSENNRGANDYWAIKLDASGNKQWDKTIGGSADDYVNSVVQTREGGYALFGASASNKSGDKTENIHGGFDYWLVKLGRTGNLQWQKTIGGLSDDYGQTIENTSDGGVILGGQSISPISSDKDENTWGGFDYWVVKMNSNGTIAWNKDVGSDGDDNLRSLKEIAKDKYVLGGFSWGNIYGDKTDGSRGSNDFWIVNLNYQNGFATTNDVMANTSTLKTDNTFSVFPNPAKNIVNIHSYTKAMFTLIDQSGKILLNKQIESSGTIDVSAFATGFYFIKNNATGLSKRILVVK